jgi:AcrR family transcriptional regulator
MLVVVETGSGRERAVRATRTRILDVALEVLGENPDAGMGEIASAAHVVRRTVYGHFPSRTELVRTLAQRAVSEMITLLDASEGPADEAWADFISRVWPLTNRYRVLLALRRGEFGNEIHAMMGPIDTSLADLVTRGQENGTFGRHLPADVLSQIAYAAVFTVAEKNTFGPRAATITSLLILGVPEARANALASTQP